MGENDARQWRPDLDSGRRQVATEECDVEEGIYQRECWEEISNID
jgi:hypothetical protein